MWRDGSDQALSPHPCPLSCLTPGTSQRRRNCEGEDPVPPSFTEADCGPSPRVCSRHPLLPTPHSFYFLPSLAPDPTGPFPSGPLLFPHPNPNLRVSEQRVLSCLGASRGLQDGPGGWGSLGVSRPPALACVGQVEWERGRGDFFVLGKERWLALCAGWTGRGAGPGEEGWVSREGLTRLAGSFVRKFCRN